jgi:hypothetical protein
MHLAQIPNEGAEHPPPAPAHEFRRERDDAQQRRGGDADPVVKLFSGERAHASVVVVAV